METHDLNNYRYDWNESRLFVLEALDSQEERIRMLEDRVRESEQNTAINKTTVALWGSIFGIVAGTLASGIIEFFIYFIFKK